MKELTDDISAFTHAFTYYLLRRFGSVFRRFELVKDTLVDGLLWQRGRLARPALHLLLLLIMATGLALWPILAKTYPTVKGDTRFAFADTPSSVLNDITATEIDTSLIESEKPRDGVITHTVVSGETLSAIAKRYGVSLDTIRWANPSLTSIHDISPKDKLRIPPLSGVVHKVAKGDTLTALAKKYNTEAQKIVDFPFNRFINDETFELEIGQELIIPDGEPPRVYVYWSAPRPGVASAPAAGTPAGSGQFVWPVGGAITQYRTWYHTGLDIASNKAPGIAAADSGRVITVARLRAGYGWHVVLDHGNGFQTLYGHLSSIAVEAGQQVGKGQILGVMGSTGRSTGPHLHFEIRKDGVILNPLSYLK